MLNTYSGSVSITFVVDCSLNLRTSYFFFLFSFLSPLFFVQPCPSLAAISSDLTVLTAGRGKKGRKGLFGSDWCGGGHTQMTTSNFGAQVVCEQRYGIHLYLKRTPLYCISHKYMYLTLQRK